MKTLIIGGGGFIGTFLAWQMKSKGYSVAVMDLFPREMDCDQGTRTKIEEHRDALLADVEVYKGDVCCMPQLADVWRNVCPTHVVNLASFSLAFAAENNAYTAVDLSTNAIKNIYSVAQASVTDRIIYLSSSYVYGNFKTDVIDENAAPAPINVYGRTKLISEIMFATLSGATGIDHTILRPIAVYGVADFNGKFSTKNLKKWVGSGNLLLHGDANRTNSVTHISDMCEAIELALVSDKARNNIYNVTSDEHLTNSGIKDVFRECGHLLNLASPPTTNLVVPKRGRLSIDKIRSELGYRPTKKLGETLSEMISFSL